MAFTREQVVDMLNNNDIIRITFTKVDGTSTSRRATRRLVPPTAEGAEIKGRYKTSESSLRFFDMDKENRYDNSVKGDWSTCKVANITNVEIV